MTTLKVAGISVDISDIEAADGRWFGKVRFAYLTRTAKGTWLGFDGSDMGELVDLEGDKATCEVVDAYMADIVSAITDGLGDPSEDDGRGAMFAAIEEARAVREAMMGVGR